MRMRKMRMENVVTLKGERRFEISKIAAVYRLFHREYRES